MRDAIAVDFDGCLCVNAYPGIGAPNWGVIAKAKERQAAGAGAHPLDLPGGPAAPGRRAGVP